MVSLFPQPCPQLPEFQSLLVRGLYHASAPIHLLLQFATENPNAKAIFISPRRDTLRDDLVELNDQWIGAHSGKGKTGAAAQRTEIFYPPTLAHLRLLLSMLHEYDGMVHHAKTTLDTAPTLLVLHEISDYFTSQASEATVSAYLSVIASALTLASSWSPSCPTASRFVVFDSGLGALKLPILRSLSFEEPGEGDSHRDALSTLLERYMEWRVDFPEPEDSESEDEMQTHDDGPVQKTLRIHRIPGGVAGDDATPDTEWTWTEHSEVDQDGKGCTLFSWNT